MRSSIVAFTTIFLAFTGGGVILGSVFAAGVGGPGTITWNFILATLLPRYAIIGFVAGLLGCAILKWLSGGRQTYMNDDRGDVSRESRDE